MILTRQGWKNHDEVQVGDETIGFNPHTGRSEWTPVLALHHYESAPLMWLHNQRVSLVSTPNHRWVTKHWVQPWIPGKGRQPAQAVHAMTETQAITSRHAIRLAAKADTGNGLPISDDEAELLGWILGDGSVKAATGRVVIYQNKPKYLPHLEALLQPLSHSSYVYERARGDVTRTEHIYYLRTAYARDLLERSGYDHTDPGPFVLALSPSQRAQFIEGFSYAEGWVSDTPSGTKLRRFVQADGPKQDAMALASYLAGHFPRLHRIPANGQARAKADVRITRPDVGGERLVREELDPGPVWCVTTGLGSWTAMQDGQVFLTGDSLA